MNRVTKNMTILGIIAIVLVLIVSINNKSLKGPNPEDLSSIILVDVIGEEGIQKVTLDKQVDIHSFLNIFNNAKKTGVQSNSQFPSKTKFTIVLYKFKSSGNSWRSIYEENGELYIDQPFAGIYKIDSKDLHILEQVIKNGDKEEISILVNNILNNDL
ncbi:DUF5301 domain-containing protein [Tissierella sp.]|uniref:DUF5301 domain-containing protein n=1 Tax=Tissierella sp. TaxID=41274 RepID=UPI0028543EA7|nr:DUF5301 domain-containing protein [Tissierella sp.]MDR7855414.1 DUF5301 domain-containing protein [Tissierella sp.]